MARPTRTELASENLVLYQELEAIRDRLDSLLDGDPQDPDADDEDSEEENRG